MNQLELFDEFGMLEKVTTTKVDGEEYSEFLVKVKMKSLYTPRFLGLLRRMQYLGENKKSTILLFNSDGDIGFRPTFYFPTSLKTIDFTDNNVF